MILRDDGIDVPIHQACAVPYRWREGHWEFCLITSSRKGRWGFPKGIIDPGETAGETALKEAWEEAGLQGSLEGHALGRYTYSKWGRKLTVVAYLMQVDGEAMTWPEIRVRKRRWFPASVAGGKIGRKQQIELFQVALERLSTPAPVWLNPEQHGIP